MNPEQYLNPGDLALLSTPYSVYSVHVPTFSNPCSEADGTVRQRTLAIVLATATFYEGTTQRTTAYKMHLVVVNSTLTWVLAEDANAVANTRDE